MHLQGTAHTVHGADGEQVGWVCLDPDFQWRASRKYGEYMGEPHATREEAEAAVIADVHTEFISKKEADAKLKAAVKKAKEAQK